MSRRRIATLLAAPLCAAALAAPAQAETASYDVHLFGHFQADVTGDSGFWFSNLNLESDLDQAVLGLKVTDDTYPVLKPAEVNRFHDGAITQHITEQTAMGALSWNCTLAGQLTGAPGQVTLMRESDDQVRVQVVAAQSVKGLRQCTGYSSGSSDDTFADKPLTVEFTVAESALRSGTITRAFDVPVPCVGITIPFQTFCAQHFKGNVAVLRMDRWDVVSEEQQQQQPQPPAGAQAPAGPGTPARPGPVSATEIALRKLTGKLTRGGKAAKVKVTCTSACAGRVTAKTTAGKPLGATRFKAPSGTRTIEVSMGKPGRRAAKKGVVITVDAAGATRTLKLR